MLRPKQVLGRIGTMSTLLIFNKTSVDLDPGPWYKGAIETETNMRYEILIRKGNKILGRHKFNDYDAAMDMLDFVESTKDKMYAIGAAVEFKDTKPFGDIRRHNMT